MLHRKKWIVGLSLLLSVSLLSMSGTALAKERIVFWNIWDSGPAKAFGEQIIKEFNAAHPDIEVQQLGINFWDYWTKITTATAAGIAPDVAVNDLGNVPQRANNGTSVPLDKFLKKDHVSLGDFWPGTQRAIQWHGHVWALPLETDVRVLYFNKDAFVKAGLDPNKPPRTWDELVKYSDRLTIRNPAGKLTQVGFSPTWGNVGFWVYAWLNGGDFAGPNGTIRIYSKPNVEALQWMVDRVKAYGIRDLASFSSNFGGGAMDPFVSGKVAMVINNNTLEATIAQYAPNLHYGIAPLPYNKTPASWSNGFSVEISSQSKHQEAAWEFVKYLMSPQVQLEYAKVTGALVGNIKAATAPELMAKPGWKIIVEQMRISRFRPFSIQAPTWYDHDLQPEVDAALQGLKTPDQALKDAQKNYEAEVARYNSTDKQ